MALPIESMEEQVAEFRVALAKLTDGLLEPLENIDQIDFNDAVVKLEAKKRIVHLQIAKEEVVAASMIQLLHGVSQLGIFTSLDDVQEALSAAFERISLHSKAFLPLFDRYQLKNFPVDFKTLIGFLTLPLQFYDRRPRQPPVLRKKRRILIGYPSQDETTTAWKVYMALVVVEALYKYFETYDECRNAILSLLRAFEPLVANFEPILSIFWIDLFLGHYESPQWLTWETIISSIEHYDFDTTMELCAKTSFLSPKLFRSYLAEQFLGDDCDLEREKVLQACQLLVPPTCAGQVLRQLKADSTAIDDFSEMTHHTHLPENAHYILQPFQPVIIQIKRLLTQDCFDQAVCLSRQVGELRGVSDDIVQSLFERLFNYLVYNGKVFYNAGMPVLDSLFYKFNLFSGDRGFLEFASLYRGLYDIVERADLADVKPFIQLNCRQALLHLIAARPWKETVLMTYSRFMPVPANLLLESPEQQLAWMRNLLAIEPPPVPTRTLAENSNMLDYKRLFSMLLGDDEAAIDKEALPLSESLSLEPDAPDVVQLEFATDGLVMDKMPETMDDGAGAAMADHDETDDAMDSETGTESEEPFEHENSSEQDVASPDSQRVVELSDGTSDEQEETSSDGEEAVAEIADELEPSANDTVEEKDHFYDAEAVHDYYDFGDHDSSTTDGEEADQDEEFFDAEAAPDRRGKSDSSAGVGYDEETSSEESTDEEVADGQISFVEAVDLDERHTHARTQADELSTDNDVVEVKLDEQSTQDSNQSSEQSLDDDDDDVVDAVSLDEQNTHGLRQEGDQRIGDVDVDAVNIDEQSTRGNEQAGDQSADDEVNRLERSEGIHLQAQVQAYVPQVEAVAGDEAYFAEESQISEGEDELPRKEVRQQSAVEATMAGYDADATDNEERRRINEWRTRRHRSGRSDASSAEPDGYDGGASQGEHTEEDDDLVQREQPAEPSGEQPHDHVREQYQLSDAMSAADEATSEGEDSELDDRVVRHESSVQDASLASHGSTSLHEHAVAAQDHFNSVESAPHLQLDDEGPDEHPSGQDLENPQHAHGAHGSTAPRDHDVVEHDEIAGAPCLQEEIIEGSGESRESSSDATSRVTRDAAPVVHFSAEVAVQQPVENAFAVGDDQPSPYSSPRSSQTGRNIDMSSPFAPSSLSATPSTIQGDTPSLSIRAADEYEPGVAILPPIYEDTPVENFGETMAREAFLQPRSSVGEQSADDESSTGDQAAQSPQSSVRRSARKRKVNRPLNIDKEMTKQGFYETEESDGAVEQEDAESKNDIIAATEESPAKSAPHTGKRKKRKRLTPKPKGSSTTRRRTTETGQSDQGEDLSEDASGRPPLPRSGAPRSAARRNASNAEPSVVETLGPRRSGRRGSNASAADASDAGSRSVRRGSNASEASDAHSKSSRTSRMSESSATRRSSRLAAKAKEA
ncbi:hypothetical protein MPSEU_001047400 [Mayamaea pseudoterrestris]|nr:hypothetical protein MPSEU_001047400 [Mayamaea pseudoterrestris]